MLAMSERVRRRSWPIRHTVLALITCTSNVNVNANVSVEFTVTLHEQVCYRGTLQYYRLQSVTQLDTEASERWGRSPPAMLKPCGESIFSPPQYFPHFCMMFLKLKLVISKMANFYVCCDKQQ